MVKKDKKTAFFLNINVIFIEITLKISAEIGVARAIKSILHRGNTAEF
ncbi:MAG: hypothetical protein R3Y26_11405 [Rikenellaceae bacterium]